MSVMFAAEPPTSQDGQFEVRFSSRVLPIRLGLVLRTSNFRNRACSHSYLLC